MWPFKPKRNPESKADVESGDPSPSASLALAAIVQARKFSHTPEKGSLKGADKSDGKDEPEPVITATSGGESGTNGAGGPENGIGDTEAEEFRKMGWRRTALLMIAESVSLGILSLPSVLATAGIVPGTLLLLTLGLLSTYTGHLIHTFSLAHPHIHNLSDVGFLLLGPWGREFFGVAYLVFLVFVMASHVLTFSIMMNVLTNHAVCTTVWMVVGGVASVVGTGGRALRGLGIWCGISFVSILAAVGITMAGVAVWRPGDGAVRAFNETTLDKAFLGVTSIVFAYAGHVAFFTFISEMASPPDFRKALLITQAADTTIYLLAAIVIYVYAGSGVTSPALGSTSPLLRKVAWGVAAPTVVVSGVINGHVAGSYVYIRVGGKDKGKGGKWVWVGVVVGLWTGAWVVAESLPGFGNLLGVVSSLFASWFTFGLPGVFWLWLYRGRWAESKRNSFLCVLNFGVVGVGVIVCGFGFWASVMGIGRTRMEGAGVWSCADNSRGDGGGH